MVPSRGGARKAGSARGGQQQKVRTGVDYGIGKSVLCVDLGRSGFGRYLSLILEIGCRRWQHACSAVLQAALVALRMAPNLHVVLVLASKHMPGSSRSNNDDRAVRHRMYGMRALDSPGPVCPIPKAFPAPQLNLPPSARAAPTPASHMPLCLIVLAPAAARPHPTPRPSKRRGRRCSCRVNSRGL